MEVIATGFVGQIWNDPQHGWVRITHVAMRTHPWDDGGDQYEVATAVAATPEEIERKNAHLSSSSSETQSKFGYPSTRI
jgi:hypothetical protein